jgi:apolipoprotein N-acyltransferase
MKDFRNIETIFKKRLFVIAGIIISGICLYLSNGLNGNIWYLLWIAPVPVLIISFNSSWKQTFLISFLASLIGRLSWFSYLVSVAFLMPAIIITLILPLIFALIMVITRRVVIKISSWISMFVFPAFFTTFEFLLMNLSSDGTAGSIAYSQSDVIPLIQIASVTGVLGITFLVTMIPSAIAVIWYYRKKKLSFGYFAGIPVFFLVSVLLFGIIRINGKSEKSIIKVGLVSLDEKFHNITDKPDLQKEIPVAESYGKEVARLAAQGAELIVLPERAININKETENSVISILSKAAKESHVFIVTGYTNFRTDQPRNSSLVINSEGIVVTDYNKAHLVTGLERQFTPGSQIGLFNIGNIHTGTAICKDLDFPDYIKKYGKSNISILLVPAWDFVKDDWLHSRMAVLRGVENGFSEIRTARKGRLTISDCYGRVTSEANSSNGKETSLVGEVFLEKRNTFYTRFGDWFGILNVIAAFGFVVMGILKKSEPHIASSDTF